MPQRLGTIVMQPSACLVLNKSYRLDANAYSGKRTWGGTEEVDPDGSLPTATAKRQAGSTANTCERSLCLIVRLKVFLQKEHSIIGR